MKVGVLALQGGFAEHLRMLRSLEIEACEIRLKSDLAALSALIIPGGESTTMARLMSRYELEAPLRHFALEGRAVWGTCAGLILMSRVIAENEPQPLKLLDITVRRNADGRQLNSFETPLPIAALGTPDFPAVFIRAPAITETGAGVKILAALDSGRPVAIQQGPLLGTTFHPELTKDPRFHRYFLNMAAQFLSTKHLNGSLKA